MERDKLDKLVNLKTIESIRIDTVENGFTVSTKLHNGEYFKFVFAQPLQVSDFVKERLSTLPK